MKKILFVLLLLFTVTVQAQEVIFLPIIFKSNDMAIDPRIIITDGTIEVDLLEEWKISDPYWNPQIARKKGGGTHVNAQLASGQRLVHHEYDNVIETIPLSLRGTDQGQAMKIANEALKLLEQASNYWDKPYEYDPVWIEVKLPCNACLTGYSRLVTGTIPELTNPFGQPFFSSYNDAVMEGITLTIEREPFWRITKPGEMIGPLYNLIDNPDFELWNFGTADSQPDSWTDLETTHIIGTNNRDQTLPKFGQSALKINVSGSTLAGAAKGVIQIINDSEDSTEYTILAWVRSEGVTSGVGRILITYSLGELELYRDSNSHGWTLYTGKITTGTSDVVAINIEILTTSASPQTFGTIYVDGLMFIKGDWEQEAEDNVLPYMSGSHIANHWDQPSGVLEAGDINYVDAWHVPGSVDSLIRLEIQNNTTPADATTPVEIMNKIRVGLRRTNDVLNFDNYLDPVGTSDTAASSDNYSESISLTPDWINIVTKIISGNTNTRDNEGRFRVFARVYDAADSGNPTLETRLNYFLGTANVRDKQLDAVLASVRANWTIVDLTPTRAMTVESKFSSVPAGQLGYTIQMKRATGSDVGRLDYVLTMPTDGGYLEADISPSITNGNMLVIDNTNSQNVSASSRRAGIWQKIYEDTNLGSSALRPGINYIIAFKGDVYFATSLNVLRLRRGKFEVVLSDSAAPYNFVSAYSGMGESNGWLYVSHQNESTIDVMRSFDGTTWETVDSITENTSEFVDIINWNGTIFLSLVDIVSRDTSIYKLNGSLVLHQSFTNPQGRQTNFVNYDGKLTIAITERPTGPLGDAYIRLYQYNSTTDVWDIIDQLLTDNVGVGPASNNLETIVFNNIVFTGGIYGVGGININVMYFYDGSTWQYVNTFLTQHFAEYNGLLYAGIPDNAEPLFVSSDGLNWSKEGLQADQVRRLGESNGVLYVGTRTAIFAISNVDNFYSIPDYKGTFFIAPPRTRVSEKRHRYVFSYDREDFINNIDDAALIGIGFVPRYLELPMKEN